MFKMWLSVRVRGEAALSHSCDLFRIGVLGCTRTVNLTCYVWMSEVIGSESTLAKESFFLSNGRR